VVSLALSGMAARSGGTIEVLSAPALKSYNLVNVKPAENEKEEEPRALPSAPPPKKPRRPRKKKPSDEGPPTR
jgi:hypothetical protein